MLKATLLTLLFIIMQACAAVSFKFGTEKGKTDKKFWYIGLIVGNMIGMLSMIPNMVIYGILSENSNIAAAIMGGGSFIGNQLALIAVFRNKLSPLQYFGIVLTAAGLILASWSALG